MRHGKMDIVSLRPFTLRGLLVTVLTAQHPQFVLLHKNGCRKCKLALAYNIGTLEKSMQIRDTRDAGDYSKVD